MVKLKRAGRYKLIETKNQIKILYLDRKVYAWINAKDIGEILFSSRNPHKTDCILAAGAYRLYEAIDEPGLSDHQHLELEVGRGRWQGYLLLSGLPNGHKKRGRIIPTHELAGSRYTARSAGPEMAKTGLRRAVKTG